MDEIADRTLSKNQQMERLASALAEGLFLVNGKGEILCVLQDVTQQRQPNNILVAALGAVISGSPVSERAIRNDIPPLNGTAAQGLNELTERERHVLGLVCQGQDDQAMSKTLGLSRNTVRNHIAALYRKIGVNRRGAAIIWAQERRISCHDALAPRARRNPQRASDSAPTPGH